MAVRMNTATGEWANDSGTLEVFIYDTNIKYVVDAGHVIVVQNPVTFKPEEDQDWLDLVAELEA